jgi:secondary thiamine-phosphate synthase enzyme
MRVSPELSLKKADRPADTHPAMHLLSHDRPSTARNGRHSAAPIDRPLTAINDRHSAAPNDRPLTAINDRHSAAPNDRPLTAINDRQSAAPIDRPTTGVNLRRLAFATNAPIQLLDITDDVAAAVRSTGIRDGIVTIVSRHTTTAVRIQEAEPLLMEDLLTFLRRLAPSNVHYQHNDFRIRTHHMHDDESPNGHSHCLQFLLGTSEAVPVMDGELLLGEWQRIFLVELDGPRAKREVLVQTVGTTDSQAA